MPTRASYKQMIRASAVLPLVDAHVSVLMEVDVYPKQTNELERCLMNLSLIQELRESSVEHGIKRE
jgi:hypothetical protein